VIRVDEIEEKLGELIESGDKPDLIISAGLVSFLFLKREREIWIWATM